MIAVAKTWRLPDGTWRRGPFTEYSEEALPELERRSGEGSFQPPCLGFQYKIQSTGLPQA